MKFLNIIRHGKAENTFIKNDFDRELAPDGNEDLKGLNKFLFQYSFKKHKILCSSARRTIQTYEKIKYSLNEDSRLILLDDLYLANLKTIKSLLLEQKKSRMITIIGHNPGISDLVSFYSGNYEVPDLSTSSVAQIYFDNERKIGEGEGSIKFIVQSSNDNIQSII
jgi:phosphohistidine phosphatase